MKIIRVIYYTQTGQLKQILDSMLSPLAGNPDFGIDFLEIKPVRPFPFPWTRRNFLDAFPETRMETPIALQPISCTNHGPCDLVILAFQPWYLSPSPPIASFLKGPDAGVILKDVPVLTVIGSRNMWQGALVRVQEMVLACGGRLCGNIAFNDRAPNLVSAVTIVYWMFTGRKDRLLGLFPRPGISDADIAAASGFSQMIASALSGNRLDQLAHALEKMGAAEINESLARLENRARKIFGLWAKFIINHPNQRSRLLNVFFVELLLALVFVSPMNSLLGRIMKLVKK
ncbi:MAG: hypothetical protein CSYNP_00419 [Syntrophus sp. SKADARSKE-3]|nr:hypothetical protein [Syntrophus sp. SKADARSKE-3]